MATPSTNHSHKQQKTRVQCGFSAFPDLDVEASRVVPLSQGSTGPPLRGRKRAATLRRTITRRWRETPRTTPREPPWTAARTDTRSWTSVCRWRGGVGASHTARSPGEQEQAVASPQRCRHKANPRLATGGSMAPTAGDYALRRKSCGLLRSAAACGALARDGIIKGATLLVVGRAAPGDGTGGWRWRGGVGASHTARSPGEQEQAIAPRKGE